MIEVSAIICTRNRPAYLAKALQSLLRQSMPRISYEIIVVDNGSKGDDTKVAVDACRNDTPNLCLEYVFETATGLSIARNTGLRHAKAEYAAYLDDDAVADRFWLERIVTAFRIHHPSPAAVGGRIEPIWEGTRPMWLGEHLLAPLSILDLGASPFFLNKNPPRPRLFGANIAFHRAELLNLGGFDRTLGRQGDCLLGNEELLVQDRLLSAGKTIYYDPAILVRHHVPAIRTTLSWLLRRQYWQGVSDRLVAQPNRVTAITNITHMALRIAITMGSAALINKKQTITNLLRVAYHLGRLHSSPPHE